MKKLILFFVLALAVHTQATETSIANGLVHAGTDGRAVLKTMGSDFSGNTGSGMTVNCTNCGGGGAGTVSVDVVNPLSATVGITTGQGLSITSSPSYSFVSHSTYVWQTYTATTISLTTLAGTTGRKYVLGYAPSFGGSMIRAEWNNSATAPTDLYSVGIPIQTSANAQVWGPYNDGFFHVIGGGASSVTGKLMIDELK